VLNFGNMIMDGTPQEVQGSQEVIKAYLGEEDLYATRA
jgi:branched-chain amino acid transport system ATP-binding protein